MKKITIAIVLFCTLSSAYSLDYRQVIFGNSYENIIEIDADAFFEQYPAVKEFTAGSESGGTTRVYEQIIGENTFYRVVLSDEKLTEADFLDWKNLYFDQVVFFKKSNTDLLQVSNINSFKHIDYDDNPVYTGLEIIERNNQVIGIMEYMLSPNSYYKNRAYYDSWQNDDFGDSGKIIITASNSLVDSKRPFMYTIQNAFDGNPATSYVEDTEDDMFYFKIELLGRDYKDPPKCTSYMIINGYASGDYYYQNNQIAKVAVGYDYSDNESDDFYSHGSFYLQDTIKPQVMNFEVMETTIFRMDVEELTKGTHYNDTAIAEFDIYFEDEGWLFGSSDTDTIDVSPVKINGYEYNLKDGNAEIARYTGDTTKLTIPSIVEYEDKTYTVTSIGERAFDNSDLTSVTIPESVTSIGNTAFAGTGLTSITIPDSVTSIGDWAFSSTGLTSITIPDSVTSIGDGVFAGTGLTSITIPDSITSIGASAFGRCYSLTTITIPDSVTSIGDYAFTSSALKSVTIPDGVTSIGASAFKYCDNLTSVIIEGNVTSIGDDAFRECRILTSITIPSSVTSIGDYAFAYSENLTVSVYPDSYALEYVQENDIPYILVN